MGQFYFIILVLILQFPMVIFQQAGKADFELLEKKAMEWGEPTVASAKQVKLKLSQYSLHQLICIIINILASSHQSRNMLKSSTN